MVSAGMKTDKPAKDLAPDGDGNLARELSRIEEIIARPSVRKRQPDGFKPVTGIVPRNAATLVIIRRHKHGFEVLMGKRHPAMKFMPGALVFPGGAVDATDGLAPSAEPLASETARLLFAHMRGRSTVRGARALAMAAIRELMEESGLLIGQRQTGVALPRGWEPFVEHGLVPDVSGLSVLARAITPPGPPRRFDTWFFVTGSERIAYTPSGGFLPSGELEELQWIAPQDALQGPTREITRVMLVELMRRLERDPQIGPAHPVPFYRSVHRRFTKSMME
jgi:8-oxo-dGTP pyrophosphatase MutT (NUDIX family)